MSRQNSSADEVLKSARLFQYRGAAYFILSALAFAGLFLPMFRTHSFYSEVLHIAFDKLPFDSREAMLMLSVVWTGLGVFIRRQTLILQSEADKYLKAEDR